MVLKRISVVLAGVLAAALGAAPAAPSSTVGGGQRPHMASGVNGFVHAVWSRGGDATTGPVVQYCRIAPGDEKCTLGRVLTQPDATAADDPPFVFSNLQSVYVVQSRDSSLYVWRSADAGQTFGLPQQVSDSRITGDAVFGTRDNDGLVTPTVFAVGDQGVDGVRNVFQMIHLNGPSPTGSAVLDTTKGANAAVALQGKKPFAAFDNNQSAGYTFVKPPTSFSVTDRANAAGQWALPLRALANGGSVRLAGNGDDAPEVLFSDSADRPVVARLLDSGTTGAHTLGDYTNGQQALTVAAGRVHAVWVVKDESGADSLVYSSSKPLGGFSTPLELAVANDLRNLSIVANGAGAGAVAWNKTFIGSADTPVRYQPLPGGGGAAAVGSAASRSKLAALKKDAPLGKGGTVASVLARNGCVTRGRRYRVRVLIGNRPKPRFASRRVKVRRVEFRIAKRRAKTDRRGPFSARLSTKGLRRGARYRVTAKVFRRKGKHLRRVKTLSYRLRICG